MPSFVSSIQIELEILPLLHTNVTYILLMATYTNDSLSLLILPLLLKHLHEEYLKDGFEPFLLFFSYKMKGILD